METLKKIKNLRDKLLDSDNEFTYFFISRLWSFLYALQLSLELFVFKNYWNNLIEDIKDNISNCDAIHRNPLNSSVYLVIFTNNLQNKIYCKNKKEKKQFKEIIKKNKNNIKSVEVIQTEVLNLDYFKKSILN